MKYHIKILTLCIIPFCSLADSDNDKNFISLGAVFGESNAYDLIDQSMNGLGINYARISTNNSWGFISSLQSSSSDKAYSGFNNTLDFEYKLTSFSIGPIYRPSNFDWFKVYADIGGTYFDSKLKENRARISLSDDDLWFNYSFGAQISIPNIPFFIDASYKNIHTSGDYAALDINRHFFVGAGYRF